MPKLRWLPSAKTDLLSIHRYIVGESGSASIGDRFVRLLRNKCANLASLRATMGVSRPELGQDIRSFPFRGYVIFFRYKGGILEVINVIEGHRDFGSVFPQKPHTKSDRIDS